MNRLMQSIILVLAMGGVLLSAQSAEVTKGAGGKTATVVLEYFDDTKQLRIFNADGFEYGEVFLGMELLPGDRVQTLKSTAELRLNPNGSIIKLTQNTNFQINALKSGSVANQASNDFALLSGKIRTVAARTSTAGEYSFRTPTALCGVRGTDFGIEVQPDKTDRLVVRDGTVEFTKTDDATSLSLTKGMSADTFAPSFAATTLTTKDLADFYSDLDFISLNPATVPNEVAASAEPVSAAPVPSPSASPVPEVSPSPVAETPESDTPKTSVPLSDAAIDAIKQFLGIEIGAITIQNQTFGKLILQPHIDTKDFKVQFYLPVIYQEDLFNPQKWYHPNGNDEWSFGTDQGSDPINIVWDIFRDLFLKVKYVQVFEQGDPFFLKIGNVPSMTLGHGILIGNYANDADFPAVRRLGINTGFDLGAISFEGLVNDLAEPEIFGTRLVWRPVAPAFRTGAGISAAMDLNPTGTLADDPGDANVAAVKTAKPVFLNLAADIEIPVVKSDPFSMLVYGDFGSMLPYFTNGFNRSDGSAVSSGFQLGSFITLATSPAIGIAFLNYGIQSGLMGNIFFVDYKLEYQYFTGTFRPSFYDQIYDRTRGQRAIEMYRQFYDSSTVATERMGIFGQMGFNIEKLVRFDIGYKWPWNVGSSSIVPLDNPDYFMARVKTADDALPFGIGLSLGFERQFFVPLFARNSSYLFLDQYAVFSGAIDLPIANFFKIRVQVGTSAQRDAAGSMVMVDGKAVMKPTFTIESVF